MKDSIIYTVDTLDDLDEFDAMEVYCEYGHDEWSVFCDEDGTTYHPVFTVKQNGDVDGFEGWK